MDYIFYWTVGGEKKGTGGAAAYCHSDYVLVEGRRASGFKFCSPSTCQAKTKWIFLMYTKEPNNS